MLFNIKIPYGFIAIFIIAGRCAPGQSWTNPAERIMSILNLGLQNCAIGREPCSNGVEKLLKSCNAMKSVREKAHRHPEIKEEWEKSVSGVQNLLRGRFERLALKEKPVSTMDPVEEEEIVALQRHLSIFPGLDINKLIKEHTRKVASYQKWLDNHCRQRQYIFQIRKCNDLSCCTPSHLTKESLKWLPDPMLDASGEHFLPFQEAWNKDTNESDRPTLKAKASAKDGKKSKSSTTKKTKSQAKDLQTARLSEEHCQGLQGDSSVYTAQNARMIINCIECQKPRVIYSKSKLTERQAMQCALMLSEYDYSCGSPVCPPHNPLLGKVFSRLTMTCESFIENSYYGSDVGRKDVCCVCGGADATVDQELKKRYKTVLPMCSVCNEAGHTTVCQRPYGKNATS